MVSCRGRFVSGFDAFGGPEMYAPVGKSGQAQAFIISLSVGRAFDSRMAGVHNLEQIVRRDVRGHADADGRRPIDEQISEADGRTPVLRRVCRSSE